MSFLDVIMGVLSGSMSFAAVLLWLVQQIMGAAQ